MSEPEIQWIYPNVFYDANGRFVVRCPEHEFTGFPTLKYDAARATLEAHMNVYHGPLRPRIRNERWSHTSWGVRAMALVIVAILLAGIAVGFIAVLT